MLLNGIIFLLLAVQLFFLNFTLIHTMRKMFGDDYAEKNFKNERRFLMVTMFFFSISYLLISAKSIAGYIIFNEIEIRILSLVKININILTFKESGVIAFPQEVID